MVYNYKTKLRYLHGMNENNSSNYSDKTGKLQGRFMEHFFMALLATRFKFSSIQLRIS